jgi:catechol 2,3-dioxygenase-like lactoylglutathione lyase family enzyme
VLTIVAVADVAASKRFYAEAFGWELQVDVAVYGEFALPGGGRFGVYERAAFALNVGRLPARTPAGAIGATELYLYADDLPHAIERLRRAGALELSPLAARPWGDDAAYFADPDGNVLAIARPTPATE